MPKLTVPKHATTSSAASSDESSDEESKKKVEESEEKRIAIPSTPLPLSKLLALN